MSRTCSPAKCVGCPHYRLEETPDVHQAKTDPQQTCTSTIGRRTGSRLPDRGGIPSRPHAPCARSGRLRWEERPPGSPTPSGWWPPSRPACGSSPRCLCWPGPVRPPGWPSRPGHIDELRLPGPVGTSWLGTVHARHVRSRHCPGPERRRNRPSDSGRVPSG